jgi:uncharacterized protein (TIGR02145 family)
LYDWETAKNACPKGWHLPSKIEWDLLIEFLGGDKVAGGLLKESGTSHWKNPNTEATNKSGFTAMPCGDRGSNNSYDGLYEDCGFWTTESDTENYAWAQSLFYNGKNILRFSTEKDGGVSVRCIKD